MRPSLSFLLTNDLLFAGVIIENASPVEIQELVETRLRLDARFRNEDVVHLARTADFLYPGAPCCAQVGSVVCTDDIEKVTCLKCLAGYGNSIQETGIPRMTK